MRAQLIWKATVFIFILILSIVVFYYAITIEK